MRLLKVTRKPCSDLHNSKTRNGDFSNLVTMCLHIKLYLKRPKVYEKIFPEQIKFSEWFFLHRLAKTYKNVRLLKLSLKPCSLFHNFKTLKGDFSKLTNLCLHINVQINRRKYLREDFFRRNKAFQMIFFVSSSKEI